MFQIIHGVWFSADKKAQLLRLASQALRNRPLEGSDRLHMTYRKSQTSVHQLSSKEWSRPLPCFVSSDRRLIVVAGLSVLGGGDCVVSYGFPLVHREKPKSNRHNERSKLAIFAKKRHQSASQQQMHQIMVMRQGYAALSHGGGVSIA